MFLYMNDTTSLHHLIFNLFNGSYKATHLRVWRNEI